MNIGRKIFAYIGLIAIIPFLVSLYLIFFPSAGSLEKKVIIFITSLLISLGSVSLISLVRYLSKISTSLATLSTGNFNQRVDLPPQPGMEAQFAHSINHISHQMRESADELERRALLIERSNQELKRMDEIKMQFLSEVAHELRTPLINIEKSSALLLETDLTGQNRDFIRVIHDNSQRLMRLINELLDMSKLEAGMSMLKREPAGVGQILDEAVASVERWMQSKDIEFHLRINEALPAVYVDRDRIIQVIINLLSNSIKFTPSKGRIVLEARVYSGPAAFDCPHIEISVGDTGKGIAPERMATIFEKYKSAEGSEAVLPSTGLGLPIAKQIVELHGGRIWAESKAGSGSTFMFTVPCNPPAQPAG
ncbi:MAG: sensor histidine kinase [Deltaproteobacteria bacterium]